MTPEQTKLARHALGLPNERRRSYRNRYLAPADAPPCDAWRGMVRDGLAEEGSSTRTGIWFGLTRKGAEAVLEPHESLCPEDFPIVSP